ncbi:uncharacterized protein LOC132803833 [Ziziphus jujuba]|uniref:Uncharacterized protein LOC132803833 n=1 Tax=Ziziphus jujuba TaxID=326968 RepID=A0ABM4A9P0_ZIZJJ|nr:uncharacterized protein LOC132803833 [Ziziphus jujuba]
MVDFLCIASILNFSKTYKHILRKWHSKTSKEAAVEIDQPTFKPNKEIPHQDHHQQLGDERENKKAMHGMNCSFRCGNRNIQFDDPTTTPTTTISKEGHHDHDHHDHHHHKHKHKKHHRKSENNNNNSSNNPLSSSSSSSLSRTSSSCQKSHSHNKIFSCTCGKSSPFPEHNIVNDQSSKNGTEHRSSSSPLPSISRNNSSNNSCWKRSTTPIMFSNSSGMSGMLKLPPIQRQLECSLEELCYGCEKKIKITRDILKKTGEIVQEEELLTIQVNPGWKKGTKITFEGMGNEKPGTYPADITFVIAEKRHPVFRREGDDLELAVEIPLVEALTGCSLSIPLLGGENMSLQIDDIIVPGYEKIIPGQGMPNSKDEGKRANMKLTFLVDFPKQLTDQQRSDIISILQDSN